MEALLPTSAARSARKQESLSVPRAPNAHAPAVALPLRFILTGIAALLAGSVWLVMRPEVLATYHYNQQVIAATHLFVLGWICSVIMGAMYQLVPVALETQLHSERLARWHFVLHVVGFAGMVLMFRIWNLKQVGYFGVLLAVGVSLFVYNLVRTLACIPRWNIVALGIAASLGWLSLTILAGLYLAAAKRWSFSLFDPVAQMHAHAHLGGLGFFVMMIVAVSYKLVPMFALSEVQNVRRAVCSLVLLNAGAAGVFITILFSHPWKFFFALTVLGGVVFYVIEMAAILRARKRRTLDWGLKYFLTAIALLLPVSVLGVVLAWPRLPMTTLTAQLENVYGFLAFIGVITFAVLGMLYKIVPFLVWFASYSNAIGRGQVPSLTDLYSRVLQVVGYWVFGVGMLATAVATAFGNEIAVRTGCAVLLASVAVFVANIGRILLHLLRPQVKPLAFKPAVETNG